jgi:hypothetical protein
LTFTYNVRARSPMPRRHTTSPKHLERGVCTGRAALRGTSRGDEVGARPGSASGRGTGLAGGQAPLAASAAEGCRDTTLGKSSHGFLGWGAGGTTARGWARERRAMLIGSGGPCHTAGRVGPEGAQRPGALEPGRTLKSAGGHPTTCPHPKALGLPHTGALAFGGSGASAGAASGSRPRVTARGCAGRASSASDDVRRKRRALPDRPPAAQRSATSGPVRGACGRQSAVVVRWPAIRQRACRWPRGGDVRSRSETLAMEASPGRVGRVDAARLENRFRAQPRSRRSRPRVAHGAPPVAKWIVSSWVPGGRRARVGTG